MEAPLKSLSFPLEKSVHTSSPAGNQYPNLPNNSTTKNLEKIAIPNGIFKIETRETEFPTAQMNDFSIEF